MEQQTGSKSEKEHVQAVYCHPADLTYTYMQFSSVHFSSVAQSWLTFATPWTTARQASLSITNSQSLHKLMHIESVMPSNHLNLCHHLLLLPSIFLSIRVFSNESALYIKSLTVKVRNRFQGLDLIHRVPNELWTEVRDIVQETGSKTIPKKNKCKTAKWLSEDRNCMDLTEAEDINRWQEYTEGLYKKDLHDPDNHEGVITHTHLAVDILESGIRWALGSITMNKPSGGDEIPVDIFQILKDDAVKVLHSICQQIWKTQQWPQDWKKVSFHSNPKERWCQRVLKLPHNCTHLTR